MSEPFYQASAAIFRIRTELGVTQAAVAQASGLDQSRVSRVEKGEVIAPAEVERVIDALANLGSAVAKVLKGFVNRKWKHVEPPSFWNPERDALSKAEDTLEVLEAFLGKPEHPWPLRRQLERQRENLLRSASYLVRMDHSVAFIGDMGVGKSTALSFLFDLLVPPSLEDKSIKRPVLETGAGGTTICEVHVRRGPEFGLSLLPMDENEIRQLVSDLAASKWDSSETEQKSQTDAVSISREAERAIRNMAGLNRKKETVDGKTIWHDPITELRKSSSSVDEFRARILESMQLPARTKRELWYESSTRKHPMEWMRDTFKAVNNGRLAEVTLPKSIDLVVPDFGQSFGELEISVIDTKGVDDVAIREDLDLRLKDPRTAVVFCSRFNDAPGATTQLLMKHMKVTFAEALDTGKVAFLALPRAEEARQMKDDSGEFALTDAEGYTFKGMQIGGELSAEGLGDIPVLFFNVEEDDPSEVRQRLFDQVSRLRKSAATSLDELSGTVEELIRNHETEALNATVEEVAQRLSNFLKANRKLVSKKHLAYQEALNTLSSVRYASTLWAATRRSGEYSGLNVVHQIGVGAARDAKLRSDKWFHALDAFLKSLKADDGLSLAEKTIAQIGSSARASKAAFLDAIHRAATEVYREPLTESEVWSRCATEWGRGAGFKSRVVGHLAQWFEDHPELDEKLESIVASFWQQLVIDPLRRLVDEQGVDGDSRKDNVVQFSPKGPVTKPKTRSKS